MSYSAYQIGPSLSYGFSDDDMVHCALNHHWNEDSMHGCQEGTKRRILHAV
jgi:hypothetical protein